MSEEVKRSAGSEDAPLPGSASPDVQGDPLVAEEVEINIESLSKQTAEQLLQALEKFRASDTQSDVQLEDSSYQRFGEVSSRMLEQILGEEEEDDE